MNKFIVIEHLKWAFYQLCIYWFILYNSGKDKSALVKSRERD